MSVVEKIFGTHSQRELKRIEGLVDKIESLRPSMMQLTDAQLRDKNTKIDLLPVRHWMIYCRKLLLLCVKLQNVY